jgi:hypothetical protein
VTVRTKTGTPAEVAAWAAQLRNEAGDRISGVQLAPVPGQPGMVVARATVVPVVQVRAYTRVQGQPVRWSVRRRLAAGTAAALPVLGAVAWLAYEVWVYRYVILGMLVVAALLGGWVVAGQAGVCPGVHCPGCKCSR